MGVAFIVAASWQLASFKPFREAVAALPTWVLLMFISLYISLKGLLS